MMKKLVFLGIMFCVLASLALGQEVSQDTASTVTAETITLKGYVIDNKCASSQRLDSLPELVKRHTKECTLLPDCVAGGYSIFAEGKLYLFDEESNAKILSFLKRGDSTLQVVVTAKKIDNKLSLISIANQK